MRQTAQEEAYRKLDEMAAKLTDTLRKSAKMVRQIETFHFHRYEAFLVVYVFSVLCGVCTNLADKILKLNFGLLPVQSCLAVIICYRNS